MNQAPAAGPSWAEQYWAAVERVGVVDIGRRTQIELCGADRAAFLHNLCTNEIRKLPPNAGCEAFVTTVQGKTLAHVLVFVGPDSIVLDTVPNQGQTILAHLDHYLVCEQVTLVDRTVEWSEILLTGPQAEAMLGRLTEARLGQARLSNQTAEVDGHDVWLRRADLAGPDGILISGPDADVASVREKLVQTGAVACAEQAFEAARVEWGFPLFGRDISDQNLPQEIGRDAQAISFVKGCYLGQETVARIDALGHVNKMLVGLRFSGSTVPAVQEQLAAEGKTAGQVTSAAYSPRLGAAIGLAYVRRGRNAPGTRLSSAAGEAEIVRPGAL
jgi:tRNA-modifying protein YgfZ